jgi:hypothetical protein
MNVAIYIAMVIVLLSFKLVYDFRAKNTDKRIINHLRSALIDGFMYIGASFILLLWGEGFTHKVVIGFIILSVGFRWLFFDILFNLLNKDKWNHYGKSSKLDRFLTKLGKFHLIPKLLIIIAGLILILI